jgi:hypothetical protein
MRVSALAAVAKQRLLDVPLAGRFALGLELDWRLATAARPLCRQ